VAGETIHRRHSDPSGDAAVAQASVRFGGFDHVCGGRVVLDRTSAIGEIKAKILFAFCSPYVIFVFGVFNRC
jgi:hypothetical protein